MTIFQTWGFLLILALAQPGFCDSMNLAAAKNLWVGYGASFKFKKTLKLMSERLVDRIGLMGTNQVGPLD